MNPKILPMNPRDFELNPQVLSLNPKVFSSYPRVYIPRQESTEAQRTSASPHHPTTKKPAPTKRAGLLTSSSSPQTADLIELRCRPGGSF